MAKADIVTLPLALQDTMPVALSATGMLIVANEASSDVPARRAWLLLGAALVAAGGAAKVGWKLLVVAGHDIGWLQDLLFVLMAPGMALLAAGVAATLRPPSTRWLGPWALALVVLVVVTGAAWSWGTALLAARVLAIIGATFLSVLLIVAAERQGVRTASVLLAVNLAVTMLMGRLAAIEDQTTALQWTEQLVNTASQAAFLTAVVRLRARSALRHGRHTTNRATAAVT